MTIIPNTRNVHLVAFFGDSYTLYPVIGWWIESSKDQRQLRKGGLGDTTIYSHPIIGGSLIGHDLELPFDAFCLVDRDLGTYIFPDDYYTDWDSALAAGQKEFEDAEREHGGYPEVNAFEDALKHIVEAK